MAFISNLVEADIISRVLLTHLMKMARRKPIEKLFLEKEIAKILPKYCRVPVSFRNGEESMGNNFSNFYCQFPLPESLVKDEVKDFTLLFKDFLLKLNLFIMKKEHVENRKFDPDAISWVVVSEILTNVPKERALKTIIEKPDIGIALSETLKKYSTQSKVIGEGISDSDFQDLMKKVKQRLL